MPVNHDNMTLRGLFATSIIRYLRFIWQSGPGWAVTSLILVAIQGIIPLAILYLMKLAVDSIAEGKIGDMVLGLNSVTFFIVLLGMASLLEVVSASIDRIIGLVQGNALTQRMFDIVHAKSTGLDLGYYETSRYYDALHRAQQEVPVRPQRVLNNLKQLVQNCISIVAIGGLLVWLHWSLIFVLLAGAIPGALVRMKYSQKMHSWERERTPLEREALYLNSILTKDTYAKEIRLFGLGSLFMDRFRNLQARIFREKQNIATKRTLSELATLCFAICVSFGLLAYLASRTINGLMSLGDLVMFYAAVQRGQLLLRQVLYGVVDLYEDNLFLSNLYEFLELKPKLEEPVHPQPLMKQIKSGIAFDHVSFQYPMASKKVLEDISFRIRPGEHVALVGENGAGKTTIVKLLCRLYDPMNGVITLDGVDLRQYSTKDLRRNISVVFQDFGRYQLTARENIWLGDIEVPPDEEHLGPATKKAGMDGFISRLPHGYDTILGNWFDGGEDLSAGEWQKFAIARAFLRDGEMIILDEPGSALDAKAEQEIFERFHQLVKGKTAILISHRLSTVKMVDRIYVLRNGRIVEFGTHEELMKESGTYAWMFETQAQRYR